MAIVTRNNLEEERLSKFKEGHSNIYKFKAKMGILEDGSDEIIMIEPMNIKSIVIDHSFDDNNMPMIFTTVNLDKNLGDKLVKGQNKNTIVFKLSKCIINSDTPDLFMDYIEDEFIYFIHNDINKDKKIDYEMETNEDRDDVWNNMTIGMLSKNILNSNKRKLNGVLEGSLSSIIYYITGHKPLLMEPIQHNIQISNKHLPPHNSVAKYIEYMNSLQAFYDTKYRYYMDFDVIYLLSSTGKMIQRQGEEITDINIKLVNTYDIPMDGLMIDNDNKVYYIESEGNETILTDNHQIDKSYSDLRAVNSDGNSNTNDSVKDLSKYMTKKQNNIRIPNGNEAILSNITTELKNNAIQLALFAQDVDPSVFTINKNYTIDVEEVYEAKYSGKYLMATRKEVYLREDELFTLGFSLTFKKV